MKLNDKHKNHLQREVDHILDSGANSIRFLEMIEKFIERNVVTFEEDYNDACIEIRELNAQLKEAEEEIRDLRQR